MFLIRNNPHPLHLAGKSHLKGTASDIEGFDITGHDPPKANAGLLVQMALVAERSNTA